MKSIARFSAVCFLGLLGALGAVSASAGTLYDNSTTGPTGSYQSSGLGFYGPFQMADSFTLSANSTVSQIMFGNWVASGDTLNSVDWAITTGPFSGATLASGTASSFDITFESLNSGWEIDSDLFSISDLSLGAGTYYLQLSNAAESTNYPTFWDLSDGPSTAYGYIVGNPDPFSQIDDSDTFAIYGTTAATPEPSSLLLLGSGLFSLVALGRRAPFPR